MEDVFQPVGGKWGEYAPLGVLRSVIDPHNADNRKNRYIDYIHKHAVRSVLPEIKDRDVLDFGCGSGRFSKLLSKEARKVIGLDITKEMVAVAQRENGAPNIHYGIIDGVHLPLKNQCIDFILTVWVLQYAARTPDVYRRIMNEYRRVLRTEGRFFALEQVSFADERLLLPECTLRLDDYLRIMEEYFTVEKAYPVRGARKRSFLEKLIVKRRLPDIFYPLCTYLDSMRMKHLEEARLRRYPYVDYVFYGMRK